ncbi:MAG: 30S ribosomal protein S6 [Pyrinomonadaceae bacterium]
MAANRVYEIMFIIDSGAADDEVAQLSESFQRIITDQGGSITKAETMGKRKLAYPIGRKNEGTYVLFEIEGSGREIAELERRMRVSDRIIRYITVRVDEDRRRAEKFQAKRARKAAKRPSGKGSQVSSSAAPEAAFDEGA